MHDAELKRHVVPAILIGQFSKNYYHGYNHLISGDELMKIAIQKIISIQREIGGRFAYVECEEKYKLIEFYREHGFLPFGKRMCGDEKESKTKQLVQLLKYIKKY